jgi:transcriptional regulator of acetoin/glycerol metabolism
MMTETKKGHKEMANHRALFCRLLADSLAANTFIKLVLGKYQGEEEGLQRLLVRRLTLKNKQHLSFVYRYQTKDITKNLALEAGLTAIADLISTAFNHAHLQTSSEDIQLIVNKKGRYRLQRGKATAKAIACQNHDRQKRRFVDLNQPFLQELGITTKDHELKPTMARKWKQINKFIEVLDHAFASSALKDKEAVEVVDFGSGKGYLTFAMEHYLRAGLGHKPRVIGVELRPDLVRLCAQAAKRLGMRRTTLVEKLRKYGLQRSDSASGV